MKITTVIAICLFMICYISSGCASMIDHRSRPTLVFGADHTSKEGRFSPGDTKVYSKVKFQI